jgi:hypothetical protein
MRTFVHARIVWWRSEKRVDAGVVFFTADFRYLIISIFLYIFILVIHITITNMKKRSNNG